MIRQSAEVMGMDDFRGESNGSKNGGKTGINGIAVTGQMGINIQLVYAIYTCSEG